MHQNWRDCKAWKDEGLCLQTTNNETAKLFDVNLTQYMSLRNLSSFGGLAKSLEDMVQSDPDFVLGRVFRDVITFVGHGYSYDGVFKQNVDTTLSLAEQHQKVLNERENLHVEGLKCLRDGKMFEASEKYDEILLKYPNDLAAYKVNQFNLFWLGEKERMKGSTEKVFNKCPKTVPLYNFLYGDMAFGCNENKIYDEAEKFALKGLELLKSDAWCTHALAHVYWDTGRFQDGSHMLDSTLVDWEMADLFASHIHWHNALFKLHTGEFDASSQILSDEIIKKRFTFNDSLSLNDATSLLYRFKILGLPLPEDLEHFKNVVSSHINKHLLPFNDIHILLGLLSTQQHQEAEDFVNHMAEFIGDEQNDLQKVTKDVALPIGRGLLMIDKNDYEDGINLLSQTINQRTKLGGSWAQLSVLQQALWYGCVKSQQASHLSLAREYVNREKELYKGSRLVELMSQKTN